MKKSIILLYTSNNPLGEREFTIARKKIKYLGINSGKNIHRLNGENWELG